MVVVQRAISRVPHRALTRADVPAARAEFDDIVRFAHTFDGYVRLALDDLHDGATLLPSTDGGAVTESPGRIGRVTCLGVPRRGGCRTARRGGYDPPGR